MNDRIMVKISANDEAVSLRTVSRGKRSPQRFILLRKELETLEEKGRILSMDICSFLEIRLCKSAQEEDMLEMAFFWLGDSGRGDISGWKQDIRLPYDRFLKCVEASIRSEEKEQHLLLAKKGRGPRIEFKSRQNLKAVADTPLLRSKLGRFLARNFNWPDCGRIVVTDDFAPYSFGFSSYTPYGRDICGGIILHGQEDLKKAYYGMHT